MKSNIAGGTGSHNLDNS